MEEEVWQESESVLGSSAAGDSTQPPQPPPYWQTPPSPLSLPIHPCYLTLTPSSPVPPSTTIVPP
ncbi:hypothetical protein E2C01_077192 [Portunus trituberculatus]|uniref:Uncharacterized protein n=1 Tax=Portunus trituberculatus TaxID=210409 RepID=A0A5B7IDR2_PORTR|nr:hypothetical protein [Portunus trituberculatus]